MTTYKELLAQREALERQIEDLRQRENSDAIEKVRALVSEYSLTADDVFGKRRGPIAGAKVNPKYKDPDTGATWSGRGTPPKWIVDKSREEFLIP